jgi:hypothetical protein
MSHRDVPAYRRADGDCDATSRHHGHAMTLTDARLSGLNNDLLRIRGEIGQIRAILRTTSIGVGVPGIHDRELLRTTSQLHPKLSAFGPRLKEISAQVPELSTQTHRSGNTSTFGALGNLRGTLPLVEKDLADLHRELKTVHGQVQAVMNDPKRTATPASGGIQEMIDMTLEIVTLAIERFKRSRK